MYNNVYTSIRYGSSLIDERYDIVVVSTTNVRLWSKRSIHWIQQRLFGG